MPFEMSQSQGQHLIVPNARNWVISSLGESNWNHWRGFSFGTSCMVYSLWHPCSSNHGRASSDSLVLYIPFIYNRFDELWENFWLIWLNAFSVFMVYIPYNYWLLLLYGYPLSFYWHSARSPTAFSWIQFRHTLNLVVKNVTLAFRLL